MFNFGHGAYNELGLLSIFLASAQENDSSLRLLDGTIEDDERLLESSYVRLLNHLFFYATLSMSGHPETRASLILRLQNADDMAAWDEFVSIYLPVVSRVAARRGLQPADADNVAQEVLLRVARSISDWLARDDRGSFRAWLRRIAKNETVNLLTRKATRPMLQFDSSAHGRVEQLIDHDLDSELDLDYERELFLWAAEQVREAVAEKTWQAFWLTQIDGLSVTDVAQRLGVRPGHIYFGRSRVMHRLKQLIQQFEDA